MAQIYDKILTHFSGLNSVALGTNGDLAAACFNDRDLHVYRIIEDPSQIVDPKIGALTEGGYLEEHRFIRLSQGRYNRPPEAEVSYQDTKLTFLNDETILVARAINQVGGGGRKPPEKPAHISLAAIKIDTGEMVAEFTDPAYGPLFASPFLLPPQFVLFPAGETAICIDPASFREVFRLRSTGEQFAHNGIVYDAGRGTLYVLWREFESSFLQTYRLHPDRGTYEELERRELVHKGFLGNSLCLRADGKEVAIWSTTMNEVVRRRTKKDCMYSGETARLGRLDIFSPEGDRSFDVHSEFERYGWHTRDFKILSVHKERETEIGIRYMVDDHYKCKPFYLDDHTVVINSPGGDFIGVDTITGKSEILMNEWSSIEDLCVHPQRRLLLVGKKGSREVPSAVNLLGLA